MMPAATKVKPSITMNNDLEEICHRTACNAAQFRQGWSLPIGKTEIVHVGGVRQLLAVSVHLVVKCDSPPARGNQERRIGFVYVDGLAVQSDRLIQKRIARSPLHLDCNVIPRVVQEVA